MKQWFPRMGAKLPAMPPGERLYAIGDVHGRFDLLHAMLRLIEEERAALPVAATAILLLGDLIDRGPQSRQVVEHAMRERSAAQPTVLKGNHEDIAVAAWLGDRDAMRGWLRHGGIATLESYGVSPGAIDVDDLDGMQQLMHATIPASVIAWFRALPAFHRRGDYLFVHAGIRPGIPLERQHECDMLWIRDEFLGYGRGHGPVVVHGHTVSDAVQIKRNRIGIDTGAYRTGRLSAIRLFEDRQDVVTVTADMADDAMTGEGGIAS